MPSITELGEALHFDRHCSSGAPDLFVLELDPTGHHLWSKSFGSAQMDDCTGVAVDASGAVFFSGYVRGAVDFGGGALPVSPATGEEVFVVKLDAVGAPVAADATGHVVMAGVFHDPVEIADDQVVSEGPPAGMITRLAPTCSP